jgi:xylose isomerase
MANLKFEINPGLLQPVGDRFVGAGYKEPLEEKKAFEIVGNMAEAEGMGFWAPGQVTLENAKETADAVRALGKVPSTIVANFWDKRFGWGSFTNKDPAIREESLERAYETIEIAKLMGIDLVSVWFGHDGVDYAFQADYSGVWDQLVTAVEKIAVYDKTMKIAIEYKIREPRIHSFVGNIGDTLLLIEEAGRENVGITLDLGHAINAGERIAYSAVRALEKGRLFNMHWGDNFRLWDDDVVVGSVNTIEFIEVVYWLYKYGWEGWCGLDQYPFKNNALDAMLESILWIRGFENVIKKIGMEKLGQAIENDEPKMILRLLRETMLG